MATADAVDAARAAVWAVAAAARAAEAAVVAERAVAGRALDNNERCRTCCS